MVMISGGLFAGSAYALIELQGVDNITVNAWDGLGGLTGFDEHCIMSAN